MEKKIFIIMLSVMMAFCVGNLAFADIDLDIDEEEERDRGDYKKTYFTLKAGLNVKGEAESDYDYTLSSPGYIPSISSGSMDVDIENSFSLTMEILSSINQYVGLGAGLNFQFPRSVDETGAEGDFYFIPIYALLKAQIPTQSNLAPFFGFHLGYNIFMADDDFTGDGDLTGGFYYGFGVGIIIAEGIFRSAQSCM